MDILTAIDCFCGIIDGEGMMIFTTYTMFVHTATWDPVCPGLPGTCLLYTSRCV